MLFIVKINIFNYPEYKSIIGHRANIDKMEKYGLIYAISYKDTVYTFAKGNPPNGYNKADIKISKYKINKTRPALSKETADAMNKEYSTLYHTAKKNDSTYTVEKHRSLHYQRIYGRVCTL